MSARPGAGPIFLLGIQRGGTNQVLNILRSHPDTTWPQGEFHEVFRWRGLRREGLGAVVAETLRYAPVRLGAGDILDPDRKAPREGLLTGRRGQRRSRPASPPPPPPTATRFSATRRRCATRAARRHPGADADAGQGDELQPFSSPRTCTRSTRTRSSSA